jgi:hypothetical protein
MPEYSRGINHMAKKRKAKKTKIKHKRTAKKNNPRKRSTRKPDLRVVAKSGKEEAEKVQAPTLRDLFEGIKGRQPKSLEELEQWLATDEGKAAAIFETTAVSRWGETGRSYLPARTPRRLRMYALIIVIAVLSPATGSVTPVGVTSQIVGKFKNLDQCKAAATEQTAGGAISDLALSRGIYWHCAFAGGR